MSVILDLMHNYEFHPDGVSKEKDYTACVVPPTLPGLASSLNVEMRKLIGLPCKAHKLGLTLV